VGAGGEMLAASAQQQKTQLGVGIQGFQGGGQLADHLRVEGVVLLGAVQPQGGKAARVAFELDGLEISHGGLACYMRNTPKRVGSMGALRLADNASASTSRVCAGSMTPSSHSRALE